MQKEVTTLGEKLTKVTTGNQPWDCHNGSVRPELSTNQAIPHIKKRGGFPKSKSRLDPLTTPSRANERANQIGFP